MDSFLPVFSRIRARYAGNIAALLLSFFFLTGVPMSGRTLQGRVTDSSTGKGIPSVRISDGFGWTSTDAKGRYSFKGDSRASVVYYSLPAGYKPTLAPDTRLPLFYAPVEGGKSGKCVRNFTLTPDPSPAQDYNLIMIGDPQAKNERQVGRFRNETIPDIAAAVRQPCYVMALGDLVSDSDPSWELMHSAVSGLKASDGSDVPFYNTIGNHDHMNYDKTPLESRERWIRDYGPTDYSFDRGSAHIVVMDNCFNIRPKKNNSVNGQTWFHEGGISDCQYKWLKEDIASVKDKEHKLLVFCCHIPFLDGETKGCVLEKHYRNEVLDLFTGFAEAHIMSAHRHKTSNFIHKKYVCKSGVPIYEHVHGASCGYFWFKNSNSDASPAGYSIYTVSGPHISDWVMKGTGRPSDYQMRVYDGGLLDWAEPLKGAFVVDLWNGDDSNWKVELYAEGRKVGDFTLCEGPVVNCAAVDVAKKAVGKRKWPSYKVWARPVYGHIWYFTPSGTAPADMKGWEVRATQTIPGGTHTNIYKCSSFSSDGSWF